MKRWHVFLGAVILLLAAAATAFFASATKKTLPTLDTLGGDFSLPSTLGRSVSLSEFQGKPVLLNFGFTSCPDVCPTVLAKMRRVLYLLGEKGSAVQPLFITVDPERDSLDTLNTYLSYFHPALIGLRGDTQQLAKVTGLYSVFSQKQSNELGETYGFIHNDHIYLIDQYGKVRQMYSGKIAPAVIAEDIKTLL